MGFAKLLTVLVLGGTVAAGTATLSNFGAAKPQEPQGVSIRQESARSGRGFFYGYGHSHRGGGLGGGK